VTGSAPAGDALPGFPRYFRIAGYSVNSYKVFLCIGIYVAILASAAVGARSGIPPLRLGSGLVLCAIVGMLGARLYHLVVYFRHYRRSGLGLTSRTTAESGWSVFGGLLIVPFSLVLPSLIHIPFAVLWDYLAIAIAIGGALIRLGCVCNGCCVGRESAGWLAIRQHDVHGIYRRRVPAQWIEIAWWLLACAGLAWLWPLHPPGSAGFAVLGWYGVGRFWIEPLREQPDVVLGRVRINQLVAALLAIAAGAGLLRNLL
jgi:prolipoprotein diacylglyceryltransferase